MLPLSQPPRTPPAKAMGVASPAAKLPPAPAPVPAPAPRPSRRASLVAGLAVLTSAAAWALTSRPARADAPAAASFALATEASEGEGATQAAAENGSPAAASPAGAAAPYASVYFGSGCFWGRQKVRG
jgi:hypothetical protein